MKRTPVAERGKKTMTDPSTNSASLEADGSSDPAEDTQPAGWSFELDETLFSRNGAADSDDAGSDPTGASTGRTSGIQTGAAVATELDQLGDHSFSGGRYEPVSLSETVAATNAATNREFDRDLVASQDSALISESTFFHEDSLIFDEDSLIG